MKAVLSRQRLDYYLHLASSTMYYAHINSVNVDAGELMEMVCEIKRLRHQSCKPKKNSPAVPAQD